MRRNPKEEAIVVSQQSSHTLEKVGIVIVEKRGMIIGKADNSVENTAVEIVAIRSVINSHRLKLATMYIYGQRDDSTPLEMRPNERTIELLRRAGLKKIVYSTTNDWEEINLLSINGKNKTHLDY